MNLFWEHDYSKRGYLLPEGCKDLIDALKLKQAPKHYSSWPPVELAIPVHATVAQLATLLNKKAYQIIADLMELGVFASMKQQLDFEIISRVALKHGFIAKKAA